jgi:glutaryl-CoA dehydrogenase
LCEVVASTIDELSPLAESLSEDERMVRDSVRRFVRERYLPHAARYFQEEQFARELIPEIAELGLLGASLSGYGCAGASAVAYGLMLEELE